jgi:hypothetical protein
LDYDALTCCWMQLCSTIGPAGESEKPQAS